jgi:hypothetical protein
MIFFFALSATWASEARFDTAKYEPGFNISRNILDSKHPCNIVNPLIKY